MRAYDPGIASSQIICFDESLALRQEVSRNADPHWQMCGIADVLYTANGADFTSKYLEPVVIDLR